MTLRCGLRCAACSADYRVNIVPELEEAIKHQDDCLILEQANLANLRTIAHVLAQTVALHFYETCGAGTPHTAVPGLT